MCSKCGRRQGEIGLKPGRGCTLVLNPSAPSSDTLPPQCTYMRESLNTGTTTPITLHSDFIIITGHFHVLMLVVPIGGRWAHGWQGQRRPIHDVLTGTCTFAGGNWLRLEPPCRSSRISITCFYDHGFRTDAHGFPI